MKTTGTITAMAALCAAALTGGMTALAAETPVYTLDSIVVTASRVPEKAIDANADVTVVTAKDIEEHHYHDVSEALRNVPGVVMGNQGGNGQTYFSNQLYINGSKNVVLLIDGMRQNINGLSIGNHAQVGGLNQLDAIDRIEVLKGSASTLYGSDAQGGVINIITKKPADGTQKYKYTASFGSYNGENYTSYSEGAQDGFFWTTNSQKQLQGDYKDGWGRKVVNHLNTRSFGLKFGKNLGEDSDIVFNYRKYKANYTIPGTDENTWMSGSNSKIRANGRKETENYGLQYQGKVNDRLSTNVSVYKNQAEFRDTSSDIFEMNMNTLGFSNQWTYTMADQTITGGIDYYKDKITHYFGAGNDSGAEGKSITNTAFYLQDFWKITDKWNVTPGVRIDHNSRFDNHTSPSLSVGYKATEKTNYYVNYKEFFVAPDMYQLYADSRMDYGGTTYITKGNPNLKPEEGYTVELGVNHIFDESMSGTLGVFRQHAKNKILYSQMGSLTTYTNAGKVDSWGINGSLQKSFNDHFSASVGASYLFINDAQDDSGNPLDKNLGGTLPKATLNVGLNYTNAKFHASLDGHGVMGRDGNSSAPNMKEYGNYWVWNLAADYQFLSYKGVSASVFGRVNNLFDQFYAETISSYTTGPDDSYWYSAPGRNYELGISVQF